jgi:copper chaperone CopZ
MKKIKLKIEGMHCSSCEKIIKMELEGKIENMNIILKNRIAEIEFNEDKISERQIIEIINKLGYRTK